MAAEPIRRALNTATATIQNMRADHCCAHVFVAQEFPELCEYCNRLQASE